MLVQIKNPIKPQKTRWVWLFLKETGFSEPCCNKKADYTDVSLNTSNKLL